MAHSANKQQLQLFVPCYLLPICVTNHSATAAMFALPTFFLPHNFSLSATAAESINCCQPEC